MELTKATSSEVASLPTSCWIMLGLLMGGMAVVAQGHYEFAEIRQINALSLALGAIMVAADIFLETVMSVRQRLRAARWHSIWAPVLVVTGMTLMVPLESGLTLAQAILRHFLAL